MNLRISDIGDFRIMGKANTLSAQLRELAARHSFINQSEEASPEEVHSYVSLASGGAAPRPSTNWQDVDDAADFYMPGISRSAI